VGGTDNLDRRVVVTSSCGGMKKNDEYHALRAKLKLTYGANELALRLMINRTI
jgi:hypothetical protein